MTAAPHDPSLDRVAAIARALGDLADDVVFMGGAIAPLLQADPPFRDARVTSDVDGLIASHRYTDTEVLRVRLAQGGFRQNPADRTHVHRWRDPSGIPFDLVRAGEHPGGSGNPWDAIGIATAAPTTLAGTVRVRHVTASVFLAQKWAAYHDRGSADPLASHDLEDILALLASRPGIIEEVSAAPAVLREYVGAQARAFLDSEYAEDLLAANLSNTQDPAVTIAAVQTVLQRLAKR
jgi:hypothetical protein